MASHDARKEELLETAIDLFYQRGYAGTSIRDIARALNRSVSNVYHYFENKEELWLAILEYSVKGLPEKLRSVAQGDGDPLERFERLVRAHLAESTLHQRETKIFYIDDERLSSGGQGSYRRIQAAILDIYLEQITQLKSLGVIRARHPKILAFNILGTINWYLRWYNPDGPQSADEIHCEVVRYVLNGICGKSVRNLT